MVWPHPAGSTYQDKYGTAGLQADRRSSAGAMSGTSMTRTMGLTRRHLAARPPGHPRPNRAMSTEATLQAVLAEDSGRPGTDRAA